MRVILAVLLFVPFIAWYVYRAGHAIRSGVFESLSGPMDRATQPASFWFWVVHQLLMSVAFAGGFLSLVLELRGATLMWLFASYVVAYIAIILATAFRARQRSNPPPSSAGRSAPDR